MNRRLPRAVIAAAMCVGLIHAVVAAQQPAPTPSPVSAEELSALGALSSDRPERYLELGEDILDRPDSPERVALARHLLVRAVEYGRTKTGAERVAASAALALASMSPPGSERLWLRSVAATLHPDYAALQRSERADSGSRARAAELITRLRAGEGIRPRELLADLEVRATLVRNESSLSAGGSISVSDLDAAAKKQPCPACGGRWTTAPQGPRTATLCATCKGRAVLELSLRDLASQLRLQLVLLGERQDEWGKAAEADTAPARDPDAAEVAVVFGVDTKLSVWREGRWQEAPKTPANQAESPTVAPAP